MLGHVAEEYNLLTFIRYRSIVPFGFESMEQPDTYIGPFANEELAKQYYLELLLDRPGFNLVFFYGTPLNTTSPMDNYTYMHRMD